MKLVRVVPRFLRRGFYWYALREFDLIATDRRKLFRRTAQKMSMEVSYRAIPLEFREQHLARSVAAFDQDIAFERARLSCDLQEKLAL